MLGALISYVVCATFAWHCPAPAVTVSSTIYAVVPQVRETTAPAVDETEWGTVNADDAASDDEAIVADSDIEGIIEDDMADDIAPTTVFQSAAASSTSLMESMGSFASNPPVYAPQDAAPVDTVGDRYEAWLKTAWINDIERTTSSSDPLNVDTVVATSTDESTGTSVDGLELAPADTVTTSSPADTSATSSPSMVSAHLVISALRIGTASSTVDEFVELYNPTDGTVVLDDYKVRRETASGKTVNYLVSAFPSGLTMASHGFLLIVHPTGFTTTSPGYVPPDVVYTSATSLASSNSVILLKGEETIDAVGFGSASVFEGAAASALDNDGIALVRTNGADTDHNDVDFILAAYEPKNSATPL